MGIVEGENNLLDQGRGILCIHGDPTVDLLNLADPEDPRERDLRRGVRVRHSVRLECERHDVRPDRALQGCGRSLGHDVAMVDDAKPIGEPVGFLHVLGRQEDCHALLVETADVLPHSCPVLRIESRRRLVEEQHLRMRNEGHREIEALPHPARVRPGAAVRGVLQVNRLQQLRNSLLSFPLREMVQRALEAQVLSARELVIDSDLLGRIPNDLAYGGGILVHVDTVHDRGSGRLLDERRDHFDRRRLARAVRAEESKDFPAANREGNSIDRTDVRIEDLGEILDLNDRIALGSPRRGRDRRTLRLRDARDGLGGHAAPQRFVAFKGAGWTPFEHAREVRPSPSWRRGSLGARFDMVAMMPIAGPTLPAPEVSQRQRHVYVVRGERVNATAPHKAIQIDPVVSVHLRQDGNLPAILYEPPNESADPPEELVRTFGAPAFSVLPRPFQAPPKGTVLSPIDWRVMRPLIREPRMPIRTLAERTGLSPKTVRRHRDALLRDGALTIEVHVRGARARGLLMYNLWLTLPHLPARPPRHPHAAPPVRRRARDARAP